MQLRLDTRLNSWPPQWSTLHEGEGISPVGEDGILKAVDPSVAWDHITLTIEYQGKTFSGRVLSEDRVFLFQLCQKLIGESIGKTINDVGNTEIDL